MIKLPPIEKIPEAYTAIEDNRVELFDTYAIVKSSNLEKEYLIKWNNNLYYSNDNSTYWQGYIGYPVIAVLFLQNKLPLNKDISKYFKNINWNSLNKKYKNNYKEAFNEVISILSDNEKNTVNHEINSVYEAIKNLDIELTRKKNIN